MDKANESKPPPAPRRRVRRVAKKTSFKKAPRGPWPIRALWEGTTEEDRQRAHTRCVALLEYWLGKATKAEIARRLELPPLRVWQLSQQALSGMLASLVYQPRWKEARGIMTSRPTKASHVAALKRRIKELERENAALLKLNALLQQFPPPPPVPTPKTRTKAKPGGEKKAAAPGRAPATRRESAPDDPA